jgi:cytochrome P450
MVDIDIEYNPLDPQILENPYPTYAKLREACPVFWHDELDSWVVTRYKDCRRVLRDIEIFARDRRSVGIEVPEFLQNVQSLDPPDLWPLKALLAGALHAQDLAAIGRQVRDRISVLTERLADEHQFDWIHEVAAPLALGITAELFGVESPDLREYVSLSDAIARRMDAGFLPERAEPGNKARNQLNDLVATWFDSELRPGVVCEVRENANAAGVPDHYIRNSVAVMFNGSYGTLFAMVGNIALTLALHHKALEQLSDENLLSTGVDELIRFDGPAQGTTRLATRTTRIGGCEIRRGQKVLTLLASANRDPDEFYRPEELVLDRSPNRHLSFAFGAHGCLGSTFGRVAVREVIVGLLNGPGRLQLVGTPTRRQTATVRSLDALPVTFRGEVLADQS